LREFSVERVIDTKGFISENYYKPLRSLKAGENRKNDWNHNWQDSGIDFNPSFGPIPFYFKTSTHVRTLRSIYKDLSGYLEYHLLMGLQQAIFLTFFPASSINAICEFGCGIGSNLRNLATIYKSIELYGADWAESSKIHVNNILISGFREFFLLDFFDPNTFNSPAVEFVAFTNAALEQTGNRCGAFINYLLSNPNCSGGVHIEPIIELLNPFDPLDKQSIDYAARRNYLVGLPKYFIGSEGVNFFMCNYGLGSRYLSGYQVLVWKKQVS